MTKFVSGIVLLGIVVAACQPGATAEWSAPATKTQTERPTDWNASTKQRLSLAEMGPAAKGADAGGGAKSFVAQDPPQAWVSQPAQPGVFKDLVWKIASDPATECYLSAAVGGGVAVNLTRWFGQFGVTAVPAVESLPVVELAGRPGRLVELSGKYKGNDGQAMLLAFVADGDIVTTLKFTGPEATVKAHRDSFLGLAKSLRSASASPNPQAPPIERGQPMPDGHPPVPDSTGVAPHGNTPPPANPSMMPAGNSPFTATVPAGWTAKAGSSKWLHHTLVGDGEVYVSQLGGGLKGSVDIWRGEMGQAPIDDADFKALAKVPMLGGESVLLDLTGDHRSMSGKQLPGARMLVAAQESGGTIVFAKLVGKAADVEAQRAAFLAFCASIRRPQ